MLDLEKIIFTGSGLTRPECVLAHSSGWLFAADWAGGGGVSAISPQGGTTKILAPEGGPGLRPNGIALEANGCFLLADLGAERGGVWRLTPQGDVEPVLLEIDGHPLPPTNFVHRDAADRLWVTVSTRMVPRDRAYRRDVADGFIVLIDHGRARLVAEGLGYTNECLVSPDGRHLYVNETFARRLTRFAIAADGSLGRRELVFEFGAGTFPDGMTFDAEGGIWITSIVSNRVLRLARDLGLDTVIEDVSADHLDWVEQAYVESGLGRPHLDRVSSRVLRNVSSLAFGGADLGTAYLGCLLGDSIASFRSPVAGHPPPHWRYPLSGLADLLATATSSQTRIA